MIIHENLDVNNYGHLTIGGVDTVELAKKYGTPLMVMDENRLRSNMRRYLTAMTEYFGEGSKPYFASKALCFKEMYRIAQQEKIGIDIVSPGELYTAVSVGFDLENSFFHGNNKTDEDIKFAIDSKVGYFVVDNKEELDAVNDYAGKCGIIQKIVFRLSPGIDPHTHAKISTGKVDSKFGIPIATGQADIMVEYALTLKNVRLDGFHCHIGSQIFEIDPFVDAADIMLQYIAYVKDKFGVITNLLNLGGGFGVRYIEEDPIISYEDNIRRINDKIDSYVEKLGIKKPIILMEPGRSIAGDTMVTLYTIGTTKEITGYKNYVSIDGGMTDNPRYALYQSNYTCVVANKMNEEKNYVATIAGRCCESGDLIQENVTLVKPTRGDILGVITTGAYNYAMASNYNRIAKPAIVMVNNGEDRLVVKAQSFENLVSLDI